MVRAFNLLRSEVKFALAELTNPLVLKTIYRSQLLLGHVLIFLALFMALPYPKPSLWLLEDWGGFKVPHLVWLAVFGLTGLGLSRCHQVALSLLFMCLAFIELVTVGAAAYMTQGSNALTVVVGVLALHAGWTANDLHGLLKSARAKA